MEEMQKTKLTIRDSMALLRRKGAVGDDATIMACKCNLADWPLIFQIICFPVLFVLYLTMLFDKNSRADSGGLFRFPNACFSKYILAINDEGIKLFKIKRNKFCGENYSYGFNKLYVKTRGFRVEMHEGNSGFQIVLKAKFCGLDQSEQVVKASEIFESAEIKKFTERNTF